MKFIVIAITVLLSSLQTKSQNIDAARVDSLVIPESVVLDLQFLVAEVLLNNPEIRAALYNMDETDARTSQSVSFDDPELQYKRDAMPDFYLDRIEFSQTVRFPSKLLTQNKLAQIRTEHAHHEHLEKINEIISSLKLYYFELWLIQQNIVLNHENVRLLRQVIKITQVKYGVGNVSQQEFLKIQIELARLENDIITLAQREQSTKVKLIALLNRSANDTLGFAVIPEEVIFDSSIDSLVAVALRQRPMLIHDSLGIDESKAMLSLARQEYIPDFKFGIEHATSSAMGFQGWGFMASVSIPFAPWTLGKANARVEEATASFNKSTAQYNATKNMVISSVKELYYKGNAEKRQLDNYRISIIPKAEQSINATLTGYQSGRTDFLSLIDTYRTMVALKTEYFMLRLQFEQTIAELERTVGSQNVSTLK